MAKQVTSMPRSKRSGLYPWSTWLDGNAWQLTQGEDFQPEPETFRAQVHMAAKARGLAAITTRDGDYLFVQARNVGK